MVKKTLEKRELAGGVFLNLFAHFNNIRRRKRLKTFYSGKSRHTSRGMSVLGITLQRDNNMTKSNLLIEIKSK